MEVILFETVQNLGNVGDTVNVKPGFARNYLIPQGKAVPATAKALAALEARRAELEHHEDQARAAAQAKADQLEGMSLKITRKAGEEGKLFGSVGTADLAEAIAASGTEITRHEVLLPDGALRQVGEYDIQIRLHTDVQTEIKVEVVGEDQQE